MNTVKWKKKKFKVKNDKIQNKGFFKNGRGRYPPIFILNQIQYFKSIKKKKFKYSKFKYSKSNILKKKKK